jgi:hypothetical protein
MDGERWRAYCQYCHRHGYDHDDARQWQAFRTGYVDGCLATAFPLENKNQEWGRRMHGKLRYIEHLMLTHYAYLKVARWVVFGLLCAASVLMAVDWWFAPWLWLMIVIPSIIIIHALER